MSEKDSGVMSEQSHFEESDVANHLGGWLPEPIESVDVVQSERLTQLARTLDLDEERFADRVVPILGHWTAFQDWPATSALGSDGHPHDGHFYPPIPNRRRMFAGGTVSVHGPMLAGVETIRRSAVESITPKRGKTGEMVFITIRHTFEQNGTICRTELQQIVYRSEQNSVRKTYDRTAGTVERGSEATWSTAHTLRAPALFRYSALTANAHRIHYDAPYATGVEGYPGLVVHGPLLATLMADAVGRAWGDSAIREFTFRLQHPLFVDDAFVVEGRPAADGRSAELTVRGVAVHAASATAARCR